MKIVVISVLEPTSIAVFVRNNVIYRPDLGQRQISVVLSELKAIEPSIVVARIEYAPKIEQLCDQFPHVQFILVGLTSAHQGTVKSLPKRCSLVTGHTWEMAEHECFVVSESIARPNARVIPHTQESKSSDVILLGAGVVNLITALVLRERGYQISVFDRMDRPDCDLDAPQFGAGATFGGKDARIFSFNESRHHLARDLFKRDGGEQFRKSISRDGWLSRPYKELSPSDRGWIDELEGVPPWVALQYNNDIIDFNKKSHSKWQELFRLYPEILQETNYVGRLLRIYQSEAAFQSAKISESEIGALLGEVSLGELIKREPSFREAIERGAVCGALDVVGFSVNIKAFCRNIIRLLTEMGVKFHWKHSVDEVKYNSAGAVSGIVIQGVLRRASNYVLSPGAYAGSIKGCNATTSAIGSMVGMWLTIPNDGEPLSTPIKVRRRDFASSEAAEGANIIPGRSKAGQPVLHCSSGHGFIGTRPEDVVKADLPELARCIYQTASDLFGDKFRRARDAGLIDRSPNYCIRPWTPSGLGIFDTCETETGGSLIITGGHNTGGFAQSPEVAEAVVCALEGKDHPMHTLYHPNRYTNVFLAAA